MHNTFGVELVKALEEMWEDCAGLDGSESLFWLWIEGESTFIF